MRAGATLSLLLHLAILLMILFGLPDLFKPEEVIEPVAVQLATVADMTAQPQPAAKPLPTPVVKPATPPPAAPAAPQAPALPPAPQPPQPAEQTPPPPPQEPQQPTQPTVAEPPQPVIIPDQSKPPPPQQQAQLEPPPLPQLRPNVPPDQTKPKVKPQPQQTMDFNSLLKNVEKMNTQTADNTDQQQTPQPPQPQTDQQGAQLSSSELDAVRSQIAGCWYIDPGKKGADTLVVEIHVDLGSDGSVLGNPEIVDTARAATDPVFEAAAEAARRALLKCSPLHLPPAKYDTWKSTTFRFNPSGMLG
jgi:hypothetical protein